MKVQILGYYFPHMFNPVVSEIDIEPEEVRYVKEATPVDARVQFDKPYCMVRLKDGGWFHAVGTVQDVKTQFAMAQL